MMVAVIENDGECASSWRARPGSFVSLMTLYESNYIRLGWLAPNVETLSGTLVSSVSGDCPLHLRIEEHTKYTTTLTLTYVFADDAGQLDVPDLQVRVYHDARLAEVLEAAQWHRHETLEIIRAQLAKSLNDRWRRNVMLNKWLDYCFDRGHRFVATSAEMLSQPTPGIVTGS